MDQNEKEKLAAIIGEELITAVKAEPRTSFEQGKVAGVIISLEKIKKRIKTELGTDLDLGVDFPEDKQKGE